MEFDGKLFMWRESWMLLMDEINTVNVARKNIYWGSIPQKKFEHLFLEYSARWKMFQQLWWWFIQKTFQPHEQFE